MRGEGEGEGDGEESEEEKVEYRAWGPVADQNPGRRNPGADGKPRPPNTMTKEIWTDEPCSKDSDPRCKTMCQGICGYAVEGLNETYSETVGDVSTCFELYKIAPKCKSR